MLESKRPFAIRAFNVLGFKVKLNAKDLMATAQRKTTLLDFGPEEVLEPLSRLITAINEEANLHPFGRFITKQRLLNVLQNRLYIQDCLKQHPEILAIEIKEPIIITGLQRTGTTRLHRLISAHPSVRSLSSWEALNPVPLPNDPSNKKRLKFASVAERALRYMSPDFFAIHPVEAEAPEEDVLLNDMTFVSAVPEATMWVPSYAEWVAKQSHLMPYTFLKKVLQILTWQNPKERWVLKTPQHLEYLDAISTVFPDAKIIHTTRDPIKVIGSFSSMLYHSYRVFSDQVDAAKVANFWLQKDAAMATKAIPFLKNNVEVQTVSYYDMMQNSENELEQLCAFTNLPWNEEVLQSIQALNQKNKQHKYGVHAYTLNNFALSKNDVNTAFSDYRTAFNIPYE